MSFDIASIATVFLFMVVLMASAVVAGSMIANHQSRETSRTIEEAFKEMRRKMRGHL